MRNGQTDRRTDGQTDGRKPIFPFNFFEVGGIKRIFIALKSYYSKIIVQLDHISNSAEVVCMILLLAQFIKFQ